MPKNTQRNWEVLIKCLCTREFENSWELVEDIKLSCLDFHLGDKVVVREGGIVRHRFLEGLKVYKHKIYRSIMRNVEEKGVGESSGSY